MRDAVEKLIGDSVANDLLAGGDGSGYLVADEVTNALMIANSVPQPEVVCQPPVDHFF